jgi:uncharacterized integral membrane protein
MRRKYADWLTVISGLLIVVLAAIFAMIQAT